MSGQHTPRPWACDLSDGTVYYDDGDVCPLIASVQCEAVADDQARADLHLIAAAPDLLALARLVHGSFGGGLTVTFSEADVAEFAAAIAKAEGRS